MRYPLPLTASSQTNPSVQVDRCPPHHDTRGFASDSTVDRHEGHHPPRRPHSRRRRQHHHPPVRLIVSTSTRANDANDHPGTKLGDQRRPASASRTAGRGSSPFTQHMLNGYAPHTVSNVFFSYLRQQTHECTAKDQVSRRGGSLTASEHTTPDPSTPSDVAENNLNFPDASSPSPASRKELSPTPEQIRNSPDHPEPRPEQTLDVTQPPSPPPATQDVPAAPPSPPRVTIPPPPPPVVVNEESQHIIPSLQPDGPTTSVAFDADETDRSTDEPAQLPIDRVSSQRTPPPVGAFTINGASPFLTTAAIGYLQTIPAGQRWADMVTAYLRLEEFPVTKGVSVTSLLSYFSTLTPHY